MSAEDIARIRNIEVYEYDPLEEAERCVIESIINMTNVDPPSPPTHRIHRVPVTVSETDEYEKYYVPKVVSIGPHHFGNAKFKFVETLKPVFTMNLLSYKGALRSLFRNLSDPQMVQELRRFNKPAFQ